MRTWTRATKPENCGGCSEPHQIAIGEPVQLVKIPNLRRVLIRCARCAEGLVPADLPAHPVPGLPDCLESPPRVSLVAGLTKLSSVRLLIDWKQRAVGE